ncbi:MAG: formylglycine-generating enzyme family protein [Bacteroidia bacterium]
MENKSTKISENSLDQLLGQAFLNTDLSKPQNQKMMETVANHSLGANAGAFSLGKASILKMLAALGALGIVTGSYLYMSQNNNEPEKQSVSVIPVIDKKSETAPAVTEEQTIKNDQKAGKPYVDREKPLEPEIALANVEEIEIPVEEEPATEYTVTPAKEIVKDTKTPYTFPSLTKGEIKLNEREKRRIQRQATKLGRSNYYLIPGTNYYMATGEVTNLDYRTFLFDLLIQGKKEEFLRAKPDQSLWVNCTGISRFDIYKDVYFSDIKFNYFPMVNISAEGAEMYCEWLRGLLLEKSPNCEVRLPEEKEWIYAAKGGLNGAYPWGRDSIQNRHNLFLANISNQKLKEKFNQPINYPKPMRTDPNAYTTAGRALGCDSVTTVHVFSYNPNDYYLYCMSGNVSEMVYIDGTKKIKTKGGNWNSDFEHCKINAEDEFKDGSKPSPMIGFRPIIILNNGK